MADYKRDFQGVWIPKEIWLNKELTWMEKLFFVEIDSLDNEKGCFASNNHFSDFFNLTCARCSQIINSLIQKEYLKAKYEYEGKEITRRVLSIFNRGIKYSKLGIKNTKEGYLENAKGNNTLLNNTKNNTKTTRFKKPSISEIQLYLNELHITSFDGNKFWNFYESKGWVIGKSPMKSWKACVSTWVQKNGHGSPQKPVVKPWKINEDGEML